MPGQDATHEHLLATGVVGTHVQRTHPHQPLAHRHQLQLSEDHARTTLVQQGDHRRDGGVRTQLGGHGGRAGRQGSVVHVDLQLPVGGGLARDHHQRFHFLTGVVGRERDERAHQRKRSRGPVALGRMEHGVVRLETSHVRIGHVTGVGLRGLVDDGRRVTGSGRQLGFARGGLSDAPGRVTIEELVDIGELVTPVQVRLYTEEILGVPEVHAQRIRDLVSRGEQAGERTRPRENDRIRGVDNVQIDGSVVRVDDGLHAVAHVVERMVQARRGTEVVGVRLLCVRITRRRGERIDDPQHPVATDDRIGVGVEVKERGDLGHAIPHVTHVDET